MSTVFRALRWFQQPGGIQARTLRTGLPVSEIPYAFDDLAGYKGIVPLSAVNEPTVGHPLYRFVGTNTYEIRKGWLRGLTVGGTVRWDIDTRTYWYTTPNGAAGNIRTLYSQSNLKPIFSSLVSYKLKLGRRLNVTTQINVDNTFNDYTVDLRPNGATGFTNETNMEAAFVGEPRYVSWTTSVSF